jgi:hypothetical protein
MFNLNNLRGQKIGKILRSFEFDLINPQLITLLSLWE